MKATEFASKAVNVALNVKTLYVYGGWGQPLTDANKNAFMINYAKNNTGDIKADILAASSDTFAFDCVCFVKSLLDGFCADLSKPYGGATYGKPCPDITIERLLKDYCVDISTNLTSIMVGEFMVTTDYGHCGIYVGKLNGKRMVAETTYNKTYNGYSGVQLIDMDCDGRTKGGTVWKYHGKLWRWMDYSYNPNAEVEIPTVPTVNPTPTTDATIDTTALKKLVDKKVICKQGDRGDYVKEIQKVLIKRGYSCGNAGADGIFGNATKEAVIKFQKKRMLEGTGVVDFDTVKKLIG